MKSVAVFVWLTIIILITSWFFLMPGMFYLHDYLHTARIAEMARALSDGHFPVRWSENFAYGYGMPLFEFYAPLPFYVGGLLVLIGIPALVATKLLFLLCNVGTTIGSYFLGKSIYGRVGGLIVAAAISLAPYRAVNLYVRGALSESWGVLAAVWILYFSFLSLSTLFLSHNLMTLLFVPFALVTTVFFIIYQIWRQKKLHKFSLKIEVVSWIKIVLSYVLATGISLFYLLPAFVEKNLTNVEKTIVGGYFDYAVHFVYIRQLLTPNWGYGGSSWGPTDGISFFLGYGQLLALSISAVIGTKFLYEYIGHKKNQQLLVSKEKLFLVLGLAVLFGISILLTTDKTLFIWRSIEMLQFVQFPWRFLSVSVIFLGLIAPLLLVSLKPFVKRWLIGCLLLLITVLTNVIYFRPSDQKIIVIDLYSENESRIQSTLSDVLPDYIPASATHSHTPPSTIVSCSNCQTLTVVTDKVHKKIISVSTETESTLLFSINYFPGWIAKIDNSTVDLTVADGLIEVDVPAGESEVSIEFGSTPLRSVADTVSLVSSVVFIVTILYYHVSQKKYVKNSN